MRRKDLLYRKRLPSRYTSEIRRMLIQFEHIFNAEFLALTLLVAVIALASEEWIAVVEKNFSTRCQSFHYSRKYGCCRLKDNATDGTHERICRCGARHSPTGLKARLSEPWCAHIRTYFPLQSWLGWGHGWWIAIRYPRCCCRSTE